MTHIFDGLLRYGACVRFETMPSRPNREHGRNALQALHWVQLARGGRDADQSPVRDLDAAPAARGGKAMTRPSSSIPDRAAGDGAKVNAVASRIVPAAVQAGGEVVGPRPMNFDAGPPPVRLQGDNASRYG